MQKRDLLELKKTYALGQCSMNRIVGCYVNGEKDIVTSFDKNFLSLEERELFKYFEIAKKTLTGKIGSTILELPFQKEESGRNGYQSLMALRDTELKNPDMLQSFYRMIIDSYEYVGNYLILLFHDCHDVIARTTDNRKLDESEEVYQYILCAICPVSLTKPGLGYIETENEIKVRERDWVVDMPVNGFLFPSFSEGCSNIEALGYFMKNEKFAQDNFAHALGCEMKVTAAEMKMELEQAITEVMNTEDIIIDVQCALKEFIEEKQEEQPKQIVSMTKELLTDALTSSEIPSVEIEKIVKKCEFLMPEAEMDATLLLDKKLLSKAEIRALEKEIIELKQENVLLREKLESLQSCEDERKKSYESI